MRTEAIDLETLKIRSLVIRKKCVLPALGWGVLFAIAVLGAVCCGLAGALCVFYTPQVALEGFPLFQEAAALLPPAVFPAAWFLFAALFCVYAAALLSATRAVFYYAAAPENNRRPALLLSFSEGCRTLRAGALSLVCGTKNAALLLLPVALTLGCGRLAIANGAAAETLFAARAVAALQLAVTCFGAYLLRGRSWLAPFLRYQNPLLGALDARRNAALLSERRLLRIAAFRLRLLPWKLASALLLPLPFGLSWIGALGASFSLRLFGEERPKQAAPAVTFYVNGRSRFSDPNAGRA